MGEHLPYKQGVIGSSPIVPTILEIFIKSFYEYIINKTSKKLHFGLVVQLVRMPACHAGGRGFEPHPGRQLNKKYIYYAGVAQSVEQLTCNQ